MSQTSPSLTPALDPLAVGLPAAGPLSHATAQRLVALAIVPMVAVTVLLALTSDHLQRPVAAGLYWGYLVAAPMLIGLYWWALRPRLPRERPADRHEPHAGGGRRQGRDLPRAHAGRLAGCRVAAEPRREAIFSRIVLW